VTTADKVKADAENAKMASSIVSMCWERSRSRAGSARLDPPASNNAASPINRESQKETDLVSGD